jgi:hypothetical protein
MVNEHPVNVATRVDDLWAGTYAPVLPLSEDIFQPADAPATQVGHTQLRQATVEHGMR